MSPVRLLAGSQFIRRALAITLCFASLTVALFVWGSRDLTEHTVANGREIDRQLRAAGSAVVRFERSQGRLPNADEFAKILPPEAHGPYEIQLSTEATICDRSSNAFRPLQASPYVVWIWRGEWAECFSPRMDLATVITRESGYTQFGSATADEIAAVVFVLGSLAGAQWLWSVKR